MKLISVVPERGGVHKFVATFEEEGRRKRVKFGLKGYGHYTDTGDGVGTGDEERKRLYIIRHQARENWNKPDSPGALSYWLLWKEKTFEQALRKFRRRFQL